MSWTPPDPFITELNWDEYPPEAQANLVNVNGKGVIMCWDKYFLELRDMITEEKENLGLGSTSWTPLPYNINKPYIWDTYIEELRIEADGLRYYLTGETYQDVLQQVYGYKEWCDGRSITNNYVWDRCIDEIRAVLPHLYKIQCTEPCYSIERWGINLTNNYDVAKNNYLNNPGWRLTTGTIENWGIFTRVGGSGTPPLQIMARNSYLEFDTTFLNGIILKAQLKLKLAYLRVYMTWQPHWIQIYRQTWQPFVEWEVRPEDWTGGYLVYEKDLSAFNVDQYGYPITEQYILADISPETINLAGKTQFRLTNKDQEMTLQGYDNWPPEVQLDWNQDYKQESGYGWEAENLQLLVYVDEKEKHKII